MTAEKDLFSFFLTAIGNQAFPIAITAYLLLRFEKKFEMLVKAIDQLMDFLREEMRRK